MSTDPKSAPSTVGTTEVRERGVRIFTYPKIIFIFPTLIMALICWVGMWMLGDDDFYKQRNAAPAPATASTLGNAGPPGDPQAKPGVQKIEVIKSSPVPGAPDPKRFKQPENVLGLMFLVVFFLNLAILALDFPRFTILAVILGATSLLFFLLWLGMFVEILRPIERLFEGVYVRANAQFYFVFSISLILIYIFIWFTRYLDYWEIMPNEILHHHGPLSDLERYPTLNLKFDKEIPDVFEHLLFGAGRLVLHVTTDRKSIVLDTVLHVSRKEDALKKLMSRLDVRITPDNEPQSAI